MTHDTGWSLRRIRRATAQSVDQPVLLLPLLPILSLCCVSSWSYWSLRFSSLPSRLSVLALLVVLLLVLVLLLLLPLLLVVLLLTPRSACRPRATTAATLAPCLVHGLRAATLEGGLKGSECRRRRQRGLLSSGARGTPWPARETGGRYVRMVILKSSDDETRSMIMKKMRGERG
jgi:hypothetical protein